MAYNSLLVGHKLVHHKLQDCLVLLDVTAQWNCTHDLSEVGVALLLREGSLMALENPADRRNTVVLGILLFAGSVHALNALEGFGQERLELLKRGLLRHNSKAIRNVTVH